MIRKLVRQMLAAQIFSALTVSLCLLIDNIMIGRFLGEQAIAAYGLANPLLLAIGALGSLLAAGIQVACGKSLGKGSQEETNAGFSSAVAVTAGVSLLFMAVVLIFRSPLAQAMGAGNSGGLFEQTRDYLAGFSIGAPGSMGALVLVPFMQMAGQSGLLIAAVLGMTVTDIALDLLNVLVFHGGMFGMGLASAISYYVAMAIGAFYFLSKRSVFHFSARQVSRRKIAELFSSGIPAGFNMASSVILVFLMNRIVRDIGGQSGVAAFTVISTFGNSANCITTGIGGVSLTLSGILFNEEDRSGLKELIRLLCRYAVVLGLAMGAVLLIFAPAFVSLFIPESGPTRDMAILGMRIFAAGLIPCCINNAVKNMYQVSGRAWLTEGICLLEGAIFPVAAAFILTRFMGITGAWLYFAAGELLALCFIGLYVRLKTGKAPWADGAYLLLKPDFGVTPDNLLEKDIASMADVTAAAREAEAFCLSRGQGARIGNHIALCIEEMASNTIQHGFEKDRKEHHLSVRVLCKPEHWVLRFRDDCGAFDPVHYVPEGENDALGIRLVMAMAQEANYTYSLNLNNLMLKLPGESAGEQ
ncbi:MAG: ATP-binding protein [Clostridia bacterium]|nr:ATP-binding protein [Clostridia bacterium]